LKQLGASNFWSSLFHSTVVAGPLYGYKVRQEGLS
jgi:hypothetical protein